MAELIAALPELRWTAMKITQLGHGICSAEGEACGCEVELDHPYALTEETEASGRTDSARYLAAGAERSFWLRTRAGELGHAMPAVREILDGSVNAIVESNSILQFLRPEIYVVVTDPAVADFKDSARLYLDRAHAVVQIEREGAPSWQGVAARLWQSKPRFAVRAGEYRSAELAAFVRERLEQQ
ncbi:MAG: hypothetical protein EXQ52_04505 [Bryobacterales bacterium]|nr:hypothetical protein [Bryobacterales bacterium]